MKACEGITLQPQPFWALAERIKLLLPAIRLCCMSNQNPCKLSLPPPPPLSDPVTVRKSPPNTMVCSIVGSEAVDPDIRDMGTMC